MKKAVRTGIIRVKKHIEKENLIKRVRVEVDVSGQGSKFHEFEFCPIMYNRVFLKNILAGSARLAEGGVISV